MTKAEKIQWIKDVRDKKIPRKKMDYGLLSDDELNRLIVITKRRCKEGIQPTEEEKEFIYGLYEKQGLKENYFIEYGERQP